MSRGERSLHREKGKKIEREKNKRGGEGGYLLNEMSSLFDGWGDEWMNEVTDGFGWLVDRLNN